MKILQVKRYKLLSEKLLSIGFEMAEEGLVYFE